MTQTEQGPSLAVVDELLPLFDALEDIMPRGSSAPMEEKVKGSKSPPLPLSVDVLDLQVKMVRRAERWARRIEEEKGLVGVDRHPRASRLASLRERLVVAVSRLRAYRDYAESQKWAKTAVSELDKVRGSARLTVGLDSALIRLDMPCPECGCKALIRHHGWGFVKCGACETTIDEQTYRLTIRAVLADA